MICFIIVKKDDMIKKILLWLWISVVSFIGFSNSAWVVRDNWNYWYSTIDNSIDLNVTSKWFLMSQRFWNTKRMLALSSNDWWRLYFFWSLNNRPYIFVNYSNVFYQWFTQVYYICPYNFSSLNNSLDGCTANSIDENFSLNVWDFFNSINSNDIWWYNFEYTSNSCYSNYVLVNNYCFSSSKYNQSICFKWWWFNDSSCWVYNWWYENSLWFASWINFTTISDSYLLDPPWRSTSWWWNNNDNNDIWEWWIELNSFDSALNYYEKHYWWDVSICYAWVNSLNYLYWQNWVSFELWQWLSIFDIYTQLYWTWDSKENFLLYTSRWLNSWLVNYNQWFDTWWDPAWLIYYNSWTHLTDIYYDNLTFPFANQPVAFYFLTDNIAWKTEQVTQWEEVVSYCNIKINNWTFDEIIWSANKYNITTYTEQSNKNIWLNPDWSKIVIDFSNFWVYTWDSYTSSWVQLAFSWNTSVKNTLKNFFDEFDKALSVIDINTSNRILPTWIVSAFIFVVLFKFLRKK